MAKYVKTEQGYIEAADFLDKKMDKNNPTGTGSFSLNREAGSTIGSWSHAEGYHTTASGPSSHAEGWITTASGNSSHAEGQHTTASGNSSHAEGQHTTASGNSSHAEGNSATASGICSHAEGNVTTASGNYSHAEGSSTVASRNCSHAEGQQTTASGNYSHAEGQQTTASGNSSHAEGYYTKASSFSQHVQGQYNIEDSSDVYANIIGNGDDSKKSNAATVDWHGNAWYAGDVYVGSTSGTNKDSGSKKLATEEYVDNSIIVPAPSPVDNGKYLGCENGAAKWMPVEASGGGDGDKWELIHHGTVGSVGVDSYLVDKDMNGNTFSLSKFELTYFLYNPNGYPALSHGGPVFNGFNKNKFSTNGYLSKNDSYLGCVGNDSNIDKTKGVHTIAKYCGSVVDGYLMIRGFMSGYGYDADGNVVSLSGTAGNFTVGKWNDIISKGQIFEEGVKSIELKYFYGSMTNATVTIRGVRV